MQKQVVLCGAVRTPDWSQRASKRTAIGARMSASGTDTKNKPKLNAEEKEPAKAAKQADKAGPYIPHN